MAPVEVAVDVRALGDASATRGIGTYLREVLVRLEADDRLAVRRVVPPRGVLPSRFADVEHDLRLPRALRRAAPDVVWAPATDVPTRAPTPWVQTVHDLIPLLPEGAALTRERRRWRRQGHRVRRAAAVVVPSRWTADTVVELLGVDALHRVHVVPEGVDHVRFGVPRRHPEVPYVLVVAEWGPHKGFAEAFEVAGRVADAGLPHRLVVCGRVSPWVAPTVAALVRDSRAPERIELAGWVEDLPARYAGADALLVTSRAEGFCLPALEAMAAGTPVVGFGSSALPEVVGDGGLLVPTGAVDEASDALTSILRDRAAWDDRSAAARVQAASFDWDRTAGAHAELLLAARS